MSLNDREIVGLEMVSMAAAIYEFEIAIQLLSDGLM